MASESDHDGEPGGQSNPDAADSDSHGSDPAQHQQPKQPPHAHRGKQTATTRQHQHQHVVGVGATRLHTRVPSSKGLHKHQNSTSSVRLNRRALSRETSPDRLASTQTHRRALSDVRLSRDSSQTNLKKNASQSSLKRNRSHVEVAKHQRNKSAEKLKRSSSGPGLGSKHDASKTSHKTQVHFDLGTDGPDDDADDDDDESEWVDASNSVSPQLARRRPPPLATAINTGEVGEEAPIVSAQDHERAQHKEYLTTRLLLRTPSQSVPPQMTREMASAPTSQASPDSTSRESSTLSSTPHTSGLHGSSRDELTSRFVAGPGSGLTTEGSFYRPQRTGPRRPDDSPRRPRSLASLAQESTLRDSDLTDEDDDSALAPRASRRPAAVPAEKSRTQQKLNLQRASSVMEPGQGVTGSAGVVGASPLLGVGGPGYDGGNSRDPRVGKLLERTGMEYLVVRRYQNPVARSLARLNQLPGSGKSQHIPRTGITPLNGKRSTDLSSTMSMNHSRNSSLLDRESHGRRPVTPRRAHSVRTNGGSSSFEADDDAGRMHDRLSGSSLVGGDEEDGTVALLRNLWDKSMDLSASQD